VNHIEVLQTKFNGKQLSIFGDEAYGWTSKTELLQYASVLCTVHIRSILRR